MTDILVEETTTLPEGAVISVCRCQSGGDKRKTVYTELRARRDNKLVKMRVDNIGPLNLRTYLGLCTRDIIRRRQALTVKPEVASEYRAIQLQRPQDLKDFVEAMAYLEMFIFTAIEPKILSDEPNTSGDKEVPGASPKTPRKRKRKNNNTPTG